ncbi:hypothetical protein [Streptomyces sp. WMMB303]|uniref:hypothetical protein n=1 Tax=Streptomyces sp. WMMB303 TaxID=3034154 RepID=UPI0023ECE0A3|nr:hypothetical protein [Streptomyces sp. WMMB303]MDF4251266.1 hypothetical protein [Streptomyces sp. WMMB303]
MKRMRHLKLIAAVTLVLVALSGFSPARSSGGRGGGSKSHSKSRSGHGGGGCSSKKSSSHSSSRDYDNDYDDSYGTTTSGNSSSSRQNQADGSGTVTECAAAKGKNLKNRDEPGATVRVRNSGGSSGTFDVEVAFLDGNSETVDTGSAIAVVRPGRSKTVQVPMDHPDRLRKVRECEVTSVF